MEYARTLTTGAGVFFSFNNPKGQHTLMEKAKRLIPEKALPQVPVFNVYCNQVTPLYF